MSWRLPAVGGEVGGRRASADGPVGDEPEEAARRRRRQPDAQQSSSAGRTFRSAQRRRSGRRRHSMFSKSYRMTVASRPDYRHLQTSSSVESAETQPVRAASGSTLSTSLARSQPGSSSQRRRARSPSGSSSGELGQLATPQQHHPHTPPVTPASAPPPAARRQNNQLLTVPDALDCLPTPTPTSPPPPPASQTPQRPSSALGRSPEPKPRPASGSSSSRRQTLQPPNAPTVGVFLNDGQRRVDFILVYQCGHGGTVERQRRYFEKNLELSGLQLEPDPLDGDEPGKLCFVKVHAPWETLCRTAEMLQMKMPLRNAELPREPTRAGGHGGLLEFLHEQLLSSWFQFNDTEQLLIGQPASHVTAQFTRSRIDQFLIADTETFFAPTQRIRMVYDTLQRAKCDPDNGKKRGLQWLLKNDVYLAAYPPHDGGTETRHLDTSEPGMWSQRQVLKHTWASFHRVFKAQPLHLVRTYFGEKIGFYFAWLGFYTQMLVFPSIVGVICFLYGVFSLPTNPMVVEMCGHDNLHSEPANLTMCPVCLLPNCRVWTLSDGCESAFWNYRFDHESHVIMAVFTLLWATLFLELWKRKEAQLACEWDAYDAEKEDEDVRPEYEARTQLLRISPVTNEEEPFIPAGKRLLWSLQSVAGLGLLILAVVASLVALIIVRIALYGLFQSFGEFWRHYQFELASLVIHVLTFITVMTFGWVYEKAAHRLTELECPRTQADYLSSYIWKVFTFEILNNFAPILYAALIRGRNSLPHLQSWLLEMCDPGGCLNEVVQAIAILLLARLLISNAAEVGVPVLKSILKTMRLGAAVNPEHDEPTAIRNLPRWQKDYTLNETDLDGVYAEYLEMMVQFGYATLFVAAFPLAPLICLLNNIVEIRIDATNFITSFRRPLPLRVSGIRIWRRCLNIIVKLSVLCNAAFLAFTSELIPKIVYRLAHSPDGSIRGYVRWTLSRVGTASWPEFAEYENASITECYYRDFRGEEYPYSPSLAWWQVMVARLTFFIVFVIAFYFIQWLCDYLLPDVPQHVKLRIERASFMAKQALYGEEMRSAGGGGGSGAASARSQRKTQQMWSTKASQSPLVNGFARLDANNKQLSNGHLAKAVLLRRGVAAAAAAAARPPEPPDKPKPWHPNQPPSPVDHPVHNHLQRDCTVETTYV